MNQNKHISEEDVATGNFEGEGFAFYRFPNANYYTFISQQGRPKELVALDISDSFQGIVIAPFVTDADNPIILLQPEYSQRCPIKKDNKDCQEHTTTTDDRDFQRGLYTQSFAACHDCLTKGDAQKIVLSRRLNVKNATQKPWNAVELFHKACLLYPNNYVSLWWTERTGCWLIATPETLLKQISSKSWQTMALAGTMKWEDYKASEANQAWSVKNKEEQQYVSNYIQQRLQPFATEIHASETYTSQAADLAHLRTDFTFSLKEDVHIGTLLERLHPTPAVCGVPQETARGDIMNFENSPRRYYAGFSGPINWDGESQLYVSLRCMEISPYHALLYAGGGLLTDSKEVDEWTETQRKMGTMLRLF